MKKITSITKMFPQYTPQNYIPNQTFAVCIDVILKYLVVGDVILQPLRYWRSNKVTLENLQITQVNYRKPIKKNIDNTERIGLILVDSSINLAFQKRIVNTIWRLHQLAQHILIKKCFSTLCIYLCGKVLLFVDFTGCQVYTLLIGYLT